MPIAIHNGRISHVQKPRQGVCHCHVTPIVHVNHKGIIRVPPVGKHQKPIGVFFDASRH